MNERNESSESNERNRPTPRPARPTTRTVTATLPTMRRRNPAESDRPELTLIQGGLAEVDRVVAARRGRRWPHPAGAGLEPDGGVDGPEAV